MYALVCCLFTRFDKFFRGTGSSCLRVVMSRLPGLRKSRTLVTAAAVAAAFAANGNASTSLSGAEGYR